MICCDNSYRFSQILTIFTQIERKNGYTLKKENYFAFFQNCIFYLNLCFKKCGAGCINWSQIGPAPQHWKLGESKKCFIKKVLFWELNDRFVKVTFCWLSAEILSFFLISASEIFNCRQCCGAEMIWFLLRLHFRCFFRLAPTPDLCC